MIITYPISVPYTKGNQQRVVPDSIYSNCEVLSGSFPMGKNRFWHGGVHLHPTDRAAPIRAVADGEVIAYRYDEIDAIDAFFDKVPYSRSFVLLKHETELGQTTLGTSKLVFFSLYMHLQAWGQVKSKSGAQAVNFLRKNIPERQKVDAAGRPMKKDGRPDMEPAHIGVVAPVADGTCQNGSSYQRVQRGDILGYAGVIPDNLDSPSTGIHFEIFFEDASFLENQNKTIWGRCVLTSELNVYDELLPTESLSVDPTKPLNTSALTGAYWKITIDRKLYWVSSEQIASKEVDVPDPRRRNTTIKKTQYFSNSDKLTAYRKDPTKNETKLNAGASIVPWLDPWLKPGEFREELMEGKRWVQVYLPDTNALYWAEKSAIQFLSDADWPGFKKLEEHGTYSADGFIDDENLIAIQDEYEKNRAERNSNALAANAVTLRNLVAKHPTEWSNQNLAKRFERVMHDDFGPSKLKPDQFTKLLAHIARLSFWEQVAGLPSPNGIWHAHPIRFIEQLAKCMWLSQSELKKIYPDKATPEEPIIHGTSNELREKYRIDINKCCYRYGLNSRLRQAHFFGQGAVECRSLNWVLETASGAKYEGSRILGNIDPGDGPKFKGRGFKQLTGRFNYMSYWTFKGWLTKGKDYQTDWHLDRTKRAPLINNPEILEKSFFGVDAGCWYITVFKRGTVAMDIDDSRTVTYVINGGYTDDELRAEHTNRMKRILL